MTDLEIALLCLLAWAQGVSFGYVTWADRTPCWKGFVRGMTFGIVRIK